MTDQNRQIPNGLVEKIEERLTVLEGISKDTQFDTYLQHTKAQVRKQRCSLEALNTDIERNYELYQRKMAYSTAAASEQTAAAALQRQTQAGGINMEYKVGAAIFGVVGFFFIVAAIVMFGLNYLEGNTGFLITTGIVFMANLVLLLIPVKRGRPIIDLVQLIGNVVMTWILTLVTIGAGVHGLLILYYMISSYIIINLIFLRLKKDAVSITAFCLGSGALGILYLMISGRTEGTLPAFCILALVCLCFFFFGQKQQVKWIQYWFFCLMLFWYTLIGMDASDRFPIPFMIGILLLFVSAKLLARIPILYASEIVITIVTALCGLYYYESRYGILFLIAFILSAAALYRSKLLYEMIIVGMAIAYFIIHPFLIEFTEGVAHYDIFLAGTVSVLFLAMLAFNLIKPFKIPGIKIFNYCALICMALLYLSAPFCKSSVVYAILCIIGILTILIILREKFGINCKMNYFILTIFLVYMVFIFRMPVPFQTSLCLMGIAISSVIYGFAAKKKNSRICGLALSVLVCLKVVFYDFMELPELERMILFFVVGIVVTVISIIYIVLEKRIADQDKEIV